MRLLIDKRKRHCGKAKSRNLFILLGESYCMEKVDRISKIDNSLTKEELYRWLPEIDMISDDEIREEVVDLFLKFCPDYFFEKPTSSSGNYHLPDESGEHGNILHTKRVLRIYQSLSRTYLEQHIIDSHEYDCGIAAVLLHDMVKYGWPSEQNEHTVNNHDVICAEIIRKKSSLPDIVADGVDAHNGAWAAGKNPETEFEQLIHLSDYVASRNIFGFIEIMESTDELNELLLEGRVATE